MWVKAAFYVQTNGILPTILIDLWIRFDKPLLFLTRRFNSKFIDTDTVLLGYSISYFNPQQE